MCVVGGAGPHLDSFFCSGDDDFFFIAVGPVNIVAEISKGVPIFGRGQD